jgi:hypothetical protein
LKISEIQLLDHKKIETFFGKVFGDIKSTALGMNIYLGDKLGLFKAMAGAPSGSFIEDALVRSTGLQARYVREWLSSMVVGGIVDFDSTTNTFSFPIERAFVLANEDSPVFVSGIINCNRQSIDSDLGVRKGKIIMAELAKRNKFYIALVCTTLIEIQ